MHTPRLGHVEVLADTLLVTNTAGCIAHLGPADAPTAEAALRQQGLTAADVRTLSATQWLMPGFVDTHVHAPQTFFGERAWGDTTHHMHAASLMLQTCTCSPRHIDDDVRMQRTRCASCLQA